MLEARILDAEEVETSLHRELRDAESAVADRDDLEASNRALKERIEETRAEQGQLANYKQVITRDAAKKRRSKSACDKIRTCAGFPTRFRGERRNHLATHA